MSQELFRKEVLETRRTSGLGGVSLARPGGEDQRVEEGAVRQLMAAGEPFSHNAMSLEKLVVTAIAEGKCRSQLLDELMEARHLAE